MNLILFESAEIGVPLPRTDPRAGHLLEVLRRKPGDTFDAGVVDGPRGKGTVVRVGEQSLELSFVWGPLPLPLEPLGLLVGLRDDLVVRVLGLARGNPCNCQRQCCRAGWSMSRFSRGAADERSLFIA